MPQLPLVYERRTAYTVLNPVEARSIEQHIGCTVGEFDCDLCVREEM